MFISFVPEISLNCVTCFFLACNIQQRYWKHDRHLDCHERSVHTIQRWRHGISQRKVFRRNWRWFHLICSSISINGTCYFSSTINQNVWRNLVTFEFNNRQLEKERVLVFEKSEIKKLCLKKGQKKFLLIFFSNFCSGNRKDGELSTQLVDLIFELWKDPGVNFTKILRAHFCMKAFFEAFIKYLEFGFVFFVLKLKLELEVIFTDLKFQIIASIILLREF